MSSWIAEAERNEGQPHPCDCEYDPYVTAQETEQPREAEEE